MDVSMIEEFISPIAAVAAFAVGYVVKNAIASDSVNRFIPLICAVVGAVIACWSAMSIDAQTVVTGLVSGLAATGVYEAYKGVKSGSTITEEV